MTLSSTKTQTSNLAMSLWTSVQDFWVNDLWSITPVVDLSAEAAVNHQPNITLNLYERQLFLAVFFLYNRGIIIDIIQKILTRRGGEGHAGEKSGHRGRFLPGVQ